MPFPSLPSLPSLPTLQVLRARRPRARGRRAVLAALAATLLLAALGVGMFTHTLGQAFAVTTPPLGTPLNFPGLDAPVSVLTDAAGIPHIQAESVRAGYQALGFVQAEQNLYQMVQYRAFGQGRGTELLGPALLPQDTLMRGLRLATIADAMWARATPHARLAMQAYADGVNAYLSVTPAAQLPPEFQALRDYRIVKWQPRDSYTIGNFIVATLDATTILHKLTYSAIAGALGSATADALMPIAPQTPSMFDVHGQLTPLDQLANAPVTLAVAHPASSVATAAEAGEAGEAGEAALTTPATVPAGWEVLRGLRDLGLMFGDQESNNFVVAGRLTDTGWPYVGNDPHLSAQGYLSVFKAADIQTPAWHWAGVFIPGSPFSFSGHNAHTAQGATFFMADVTDLFAVSATAVSNTRQETFKGANLPGPIPIRDTALGPILNDLLPLPPSFPLVAVDAAVAHPPYTIDGFFDLPYAHDLADVRDALSRVSIGLNYLIGTRAGEHGHIAYQASCLCPQRNRENLHGIVPADAAHAWSGFAPFAALPHVADPPSGILVTANNRILPSAAALVVGEQWDDASRAQQLARGLLDLTADGRRVTAPQLAALQLDVQSPHAREIASLLIAAAVRGQRAAGGGTLAGTALGTDLATLALWDGRLGASSRGALIYTLTVLLAMRDLAHGALGDDLYALYAPNTFISAQVQALRAQLEHPAPPLLADGAARDALVLRAVGEARDMMRLTDATVYGDLHQRSARPDLQHPLAGLVPALAVPAVAAGGGWDTPATGGWFQQSVRLQPVGGAVPTADDARAALAADARPDERSVWDVGAWSASLYLSSQGQSGLPTSAHYHDGYDGYATNAVAAFHRFAFGQADVATDDNLLPPR